MLTSGAAQTKAARLRSGLPGDPGVHTGERERERVPGLTFLGDVMGTKQSFFFGLTENVSWYETGM